MPADQSKPESAAPIKTPAQAMRDVLERYTVWDHVEHFDVDDENNPDNPPVFTGTRDECETYRMERAYAAGRAAEFRVRPLSEWHEDIGDVLWYRLPVDEPPYVGTPNDSDWPHKLPYTHWQPLPPAPVGEG